MMLEPPVGRSLAILICTCPIPTFAYVHASQAFCRPGLTATINLQGARCTPSDAGVICREQLYMCHAARSTGTLQARSLASRPTDSHQST